MVVMPRRISVARSNGKVVVILDGVKHTLTKPAFLELMLKAQPVLDALAREEAQREGPTAHR